jgi:tRNA A-37 threonylcarbamoyl transferase component Bud32
MANRNHAPAGASQPTARPQRTSGLCRASASTEQVRGRLLGRYRLRELIGTGAMGEVYRAEHMLLGRTVALKVLRPEVASDRDMGERFLAEARAVNLIAHPHIVEISDFQREDDGTLWFVMELLEGEDLAERLKAGPLPLPAAIAIVRQICDALASVHEAEIVHRDIKPENVFLAKRDGQDFVKLLDFGIAQLPSGEVANGLTMRGSVLGTPPYMAPEQACGDAVDHRCDLYAVGAILFELLSGKPLFSRQSVRELLMDITYAEPPRLSECAELPADLRPDLDRFMTWCLAKRPEDRPASARELDAALALLERRLPATEGAEVNAEARSFATIVDGDAGASVGRDADGPPLSEGELEPERACDGQDSQASPGALPLTARVPSPVRWALATAIGLVACGALVQSAGLAEAVAGRGLGWAVFDGTRADTPNHSIAGGLPGSVGEPAAAAGEPTAAGAAPAVPGAALSATEPHRGDADERPGVSALPPSTIDEGEGQPRSPQASKRRRARRQQHVALAATAGDDASRVAAVEASSEATGSSTRPRRQARMQVPDATRSVLDPDLLLSPFQVP